MGLVHQLYHHVDQNIAEIDYQDKVTYVYKTIDGKPIELNPFYVQSVNEQSLHWACNSCYNKIQKEYKKLFIYKERYESMECNNIFI